MALKSRLAISFGGVACHKCHNDKACSFPLRTVNKEEFRSPYMGFFERMAGKTELTVQAKMLESLSTAVSVLGQDVRFGPAKLICPFVQEEHNGFFVSGKKGCNAFFRCKGSWWSIAASGDEKAQYESGKELAMYMTSAFSSPSSLGPVSQQVEPLVVEMVSRVIH